MKSAPSLQLTKFNELKPLILHTHTHTHTRITIQTHFDHSSKKQATHALQPYPANMINKTNKEI